MNDADASGASALVVAAHSGHGSFAQMLLERGADPNAAGAGYAALHAAVLRGDVGLVKALLAKGAKADKQDKNGWTPADYMTLWEQGTGAAEKLKQYTDMIEGKNTPAIKPRSITPKH